MGLCLCVPRSSASTETQEPRTLQHQLQLMTKDLRSISERALLDTTPRTESSSPTPLNTPKFDYDLCVFSGVPEVHAKLYDEHGDLVCLSSMEFSEREIVAACDAIQARLIGWLRDMASSESPRSVSSDPDDSDVERLSDGATSRFVPIWQHACSSTEVGHPKIVYAALSKMDRVVTLESFAAGGTRSTLQRDERTVRLGVRLLRSLAGYYAKHYRHERFLINEITIRGAFMSGEGAAKAMHSLCDESAFDPVPGQPLSFRCKF